MKMATMVRRSSMTISLWWTLRTPLATVLLRGQGVQAWAATQPVKQAGVQLYVLGEGDDLPPGHVVGLTNALGVGPVGSKWEHDGYPFRVNRRLSNFLQHKRRTT